MAFSRAIRRGATLMELILGMAMLVVLLGATTSLYAYTARNVSEQGADAAVQLQADQLANEVLKFVTMAKTCKTVVSGPCQALVCEMPQTGTDQDYDGVLDHFVPDASVAGREVYMTGFYVWFYMSDSTGTWGVPGDRMWRAIVYSSAPPTSGDLDHAWTKYYGGNYRWNLIDNFSATVDKINQLTTFSVYASSLDRAERLAKTDLTAKNTTFSLTRTAYWQSFRNMIVNGSFEYPDVAGTGWGYFMDDGLPGGWVKTSSTPFEIQFGSFGAQSYRGKQHLELDGDVPGSIMQTLVTDPGQQYELSFFYTPRPGCASNTIRVKWNGATVTVLNGNGVGLPGSAAWTQYTFNVTATGTTTDLEFIDESNVGDKTGGLLDNVVVMPK